MRALTVVVALLWTSGVVASERLRVEGAASVAEPLAGAVMERFGNRYADLELEWSGTGSGAALGALLAGNASVAVTSTDASSYERELAARLGLELEEVPLALSGIAVVVHPDNDVPSLSLGDLEALYAGRIVRWLGFGGPDEEVRLLSLPESSGVREDFEELVLGNVQGGARPGPGVTFLSATRLLERVASDRGAVGFVSSSRDRSSVRTVPIRASESEEALLPTPETVPGGYVLRHAVWFYVLGEPRSGLRRFITFLLLHDGPKLLEEAGFVPVPSFGVVARHVGLPQVSSVETSVTRIPFGFRARRLRRSARRRLSSLVETLRDRDVVLWVAGHVEPSEQRPDLALARAEAVADVLAGTGWDRARIVVHARGSREPVASNETREGRQANRRADVWVLPVR